MSCVAAATADLVRAAGPRFEKEGAAPVAAPSPAPKRRGVGVGENGDPGVAGTLDLPTRGTKNGE